MVLVLHSPPPAPCGIGAHVEDLAGSEGAGHDQGDASEAVGLGGVHREDFAARLGAQPRGIPLEPGQHRPDPGAGLLAVFQLGEQAPGARLGKRELPDGGRAPSAGLALVPDHREQLRQRGPRQGAGVPAQSRQKDEPGGLVPHHLHDGGALPGAQLPVGDPDVPQQDHVVGCEGIVGGEGGEVIAAGPGLPEVRMEKEGGDLHAGIALQGIAQIAVFPARETLDHQYPQGLAPDFKLGFPAVVGGVVLVGGRRDVEGQADLARATGPPEQGVLQRSHRGQHEFLAHLFAGGGCHGHRDHFFARQGRIDGEGDPQRFARHRKGRGTSKLTISTSGKRVSEPVGTAMTGTPRMRR